MQDLLQDFDSPSVMDCKMGTRYTTLHEKNINTQNITSQVVVA